MLPQLQRHVPIGHGAAAAVAGFLSLAVRKGRGAGCAPHHLGPRPALQSSKHPHRLRKPHSPHTTHPHALADGCLPTACLDYENLTPSPRAPAPCPRPAPPVSHKPGCMKIKVHYLSATYERYYYRLQPYTTMHRLLLTRHYLHYEALQLPSPHRRDWLRPEGWLN